MVKNHRAKTFLSQLIVLLAYMQIDLTNGTTFFLGWLTGMATIFCLMAITFEKGKTK